MSASFKICRKETLSVFWYYETVLHKDAVGLLDRFSGDSQFGGKVIHRGNLLPGLQASIVQGSFYLHHKLFVDGLSTPRVNCEDHIPKYSR